MRTEIDYMAEFDDFWRPLVTDENGNLDVDKVARELADYRVVMQEASKVYEELANLSKPNTAAVHVIEGADRKYAALYAEFLLDAIDDGEPLTRQDIIDIANDWHEGAWDEHQQHRRQITEAIDKAFDAAEVSS